MPAISRAVIEPRSSTTAIRAQNIRAVMRDDEWIAIESRNAQHVFIGQFARTECCEYLILLFSPNYSSVLVPVCEQFARRRKESNGRPIVFLPCPMNRSSNYPE
jgi:hypothetical protein